MTKPVNRTFLVLAVSVRVLSILVIPLYQYIESPVRRWSSFRPSIFAHHMLKHVANSTKPEQVSKMFLYFLWFPAFAGISGDSEEKCKIFFETCLYRNMCKELKHTRGKYTAVLRREFFELHHRTFFALQHQSSLMHYTLY